jgi:hypothetical protein
LGTPTGGRKRECGILGYIAGYGDVPKFTVTRKVRPAGMITRLQKSSVHIFFWEKVNWHVTRFAKQHHVPAFTNDLAIKTNAHAPRARFKYMIWIR